MGCNGFFPSAAASAAIESVIAGNALMVLAFAIAVLAARELARARTAIHPGKRAAALVRTGVFARSRNPIYLSFVFFMVGFGLATANPWMIILAPLLRSLCPGTHYQTRRGLSDPALRAGLYRLTGRRCGVGFDASTLPFLALSTTFRLIRSSRLPASISSV